MMERKSRRGECLSRRRWLQGTGAGLAAGALGAAASARAAPPHRATGSLPRRIERVEAFALRYPTVAYFKFFEGPPGAPLGRPAVVVKITADDGTVGWGESVPIPRWSYETLEGAAAAIEGYIGPALVGRDPFDLAGAHGVMDQNIAGSFQKGAPITKSGVDMALHDLAGRALGESLAQRWGRARGGPITLSWTLNPRSLDEVEGLIAAGRARGYENFNLKVAPNAEFDLELCRLARKLAPDGFLWADANGGYDPHTAMQVAPKMADLGVDILEQPVPVSRIAACQALKRQGAVPVVLDEGVVSPGALIEFIRLDMLDGIAMKPARCGGLQPARRQVEILEDAGLLFLGSGLTDPDISLAATLALYGAFGLRFPAALNGPQFLGASVLKQPFQPEGGKLEVPAGPGLGIEVDEEKVRRLAARSR